jgi:hypothetical protein
LLEQLLLEQALPFVSADAVLLTEDCTNCTFKFAIDKLAILGIAQMESSTACGICKVSRTRTNKVD